jgi:hypothetical protein
VAKELSAESIAAATGRTWDEWVAYFDSQGAESMSHQELVSLSSGAGVPPWWRQMIAVKYEQHIGRRVPGQGNGGTFNVSASKTWSGSLDDALARWTKVMDPRTEVSGVEIARGPDVSATEKWRYWRAGLADGTRVVVNISAKSPDKSVISVQHENLESEDAAQHWRGFWKSVLSDI